MWVWLDGFGQILIDATLATAILLSLVILLILLCQQPARRIVLARTAVVLTLFMFPLTSAGPLAWLRATSLYQALGPAIIEHPSASPPAVIPPEPSVRNLSPPEATFPAQPADSWWLGAWPRRLFALVYLAGSSLAILWTLLGFWGMHRLIRDATYASPGSTTLYDELAGQTSARFPLPALRVSSRIHRPVLLGLFRPVILIPPAHDEAAFDREALRLILLHEMAHAAQGDTLFSAAAALAQSLWFFLPLLWWICVQLRLDQEFLADHIVVTTTGSPAGYATRLVMLAAPTKQPDRAEMAREAPSFSPRFWSDGNSASPLFQRVLMLLHCPYPLEPELPRWWTLSVPPLTLGLALLSVWMSLALVDRSVLQGGSMSPAKVPGRFVVSQFVAPPTNSTASGRNSFYTLPLLLPPEFDLTVEIQASPSALRRVRLLGLPLVPANDASDGVPNTPASTGKGAPWHQVNCGRRHDGLFLSIDGETHVLTKGSGALSEWLTIEPAPDETVILRNLVITW